MIKARFFRNDNDRLYGFKIANHGNPIVCAAVSALTINTVNSIELLTGEKFSRFVCKRCGIIKISIPKLEEGNQSNDTELLLKSFLLGLTDIQKEYSKHIKIIDERKN